MKVIPEHEFAAQMNHLMQNVLDIAADSPDARDVASDLKAIVALARANPVHADIGAQLFVGLLEERPGHLILGVPGMVDILEFSMHELRWPLVHAAVSRLAESASDPRVSRAAERVLEAFEADWDGGDIYVQRKDDLYVRTDTPSERVASNLRHRLRRLSRARRGRGRLSRDDDHVPLSCE